MGGSEKARRAEVLQQAERRTQRVVLAPETTAALDPHPRDPALPQSIQGEAEGEARAPR